MVSKFRLQVVAVIVSVGLLASPLLAKVKVNVGLDKTFAFKGVRTWAWNPEANGRVLMGRTQGDDPEAMRKRAEPVILDAVSTEMGRLGLQTAANQPDLTVTYYLLLTIGSATQTMGQFLPATPYWGLPPFAPSTSALTVMNSGSLVLDLSANGNVVWRGVAQAQISMDATEEKRSDVVREAVRELLKKYPKR